MPGCTFQKPCPLYKCHNSLLHQHYTAQQNWCGRRESTRFYYPARSKTLPSSRGSPDSVQQKQQIVSSRTKHALNHTIHSTVSTACQNMASPPSIKLSVSNLRTSSMKSDVIVKCPRNNPLCQIISQQAKLTEYSTPILYIQQSAVKQRPKKQKIKRKTKGTGFSFIGFPLSVTFHHCFILILVQSGSITDHGKCFKIKSINSWHEKWH